MKSLDLPRKYSALAIAAGVVCFAAAAAQVFGLARGTVGDHLFVFMSLLVLTGLALWCVWWEYRNWKLLWIIGFPVAAAFLIRAFCLDYASGDYNSFLCHWVEFFRQNGGFRAIAQNIGDYNVPYLYFIAAISYLNVPDLYLYKLFSLLFDVLLAWGGLRLTRAVLPDRVKGQVPVMVFLVILFLPTVVLNGAYWGQCDAVYGAIVVHALAFLLKDKPKSSAALIAVAFSFKLQTIFVLPLWGVMWLAKKVKFRHLCLFPVTYVGTILPAMLLGKPLADILGVYFNQMGEYSSLTLNAPSVFQFVPYKLEVNEGFLEKLGILAAFLLVVALLVLGLLIGRRFNRQVFFSMAVVMVIGIPFFLPHMHERYFFLADVLTVCWASTNQWRIPVCVLANGSSLACYIVYLRLKYNYIVTIGEYRFVMALEAMAMLLALILAIGALIRQINSCKAKNVYGGSEDEVGVMECEWSAGMPEERVRGVGDGAGTGRDLSSRDENGTGTGGGRASGIL